jgi:Holliday junction resolvase RusA-like endonuclease
LRQRLVEEISNGGTQRASEDLGSEEPWRQALLTGDISVSITLYFGTKRRADLDNFNKLSLDALSGIVYEDDSQIAELHLKRAYDKARPRIEVDIGLMAASDE